MLDNLFQELADHHRTGETRRAVAFDTLAYEAGMLHWLFHQTRGDTQDDASLHQFAQALAVWGVGYTPAQLVALLTLGLGMQIDADTGRDWSQPLQ